MRTAFSAHYYLGTSHGLRLGFPKSPYFENPIQMETRDDPIDDLVGGLVVSLWPIICIFYEFPSTLSAVRHESPSQWIFKRKCFWKAKTKTSQGSDAVRVTKGT